MAATKGRHWSTVRFRTRIRVGMLGKRLQDHALGLLEKPMDATQIRAAEILLKKAVPDLSAVEHSGVVERSASEMTRAELLAIVQSDGSQGTVAPGVGDTESGRPH